MDPEADLTSISKMLAGLDFRYQADIVALLTAVDPDHSRICELLVESKNDMEGWKEFTAQLMLHDNEILDLWDRKRNEAANSGTWMHAMIEHLLNGYMVRANPMQGELNAAIRILAQMGSVEVYRTEWCIYAVDEDVAGSIDLVLKKTDADVYYLVDWKRSEKLQDKYNSFGKSMKPPLHEVPDCQGFHYRLQLNIYRWILEKYYEAEVRDMKVICVHPCYLPQGLVDDVPDMQAEVTQLMQSRRDSLMAQNLQRTMEVDEVSVAPDVVSPTDDVPAARASTKVYENRLAQGVVHQGTPGYRKCTHMVRQRRSSRSQPEKRLHIVLKHGGTLQKHWIEAAMMELPNLSTSAQSQVLAWFRYAGPRPLNFPKI